VPGGHLVHPEKKPEAFPKLQFLGKQPWIYDISFISRMLYTKAEPVSEPGLVWNSLK
jgi:hypothetical protein